MLWKKSAKKVDFTGESKKALIDISGANCTSCVYTIEHVGRKFAGVKECYVDRNSSQIQLEYDGRQETLDEIVNLVDKIGYSAVVNQSDLSDFSGPFPDSSPEARK